MYIIYVHFVNIHVHVYYVYLVTHVYTDLQAKSSAQRFKVTSQMRCVQTSDAGSEGNSADAASAVGGGGGGAAGTGKSVHICDAVQDSERNYEEDVRYMHNYTTSPVLQYLCY